MMDTTWLVVFREVARRGSFTAAGRVLGYTQSAVSRQVSSLESELAATLFDRLPRGVRLTAEGRSLHEHATVVLDRLDAARDELADLGALNAGRLRLGAFPNANATLVPRAMAAFRAAYPDISLFLAEGTTPTLSARLADGDLDVAVLTTSGQGQVGDGRLDVRELADDPLFAALPHGHRLAGRKTVRLAELAGDTWVAGSTLIDETLLAPGRADFRPRVDFVAAEWVAKLGMVASGLGVTAVPWLAAEAARPDVALVALHAEDAPPRRIAVAVPGGAEPARAVTAFLGVLDGTLAEMRAALAERLR